MTAIKDAITSLQNGDSSKFKEAINQALLDRAMDSINVERMVAGQKFFDEPEEDFEETETFEGEEEAAPEEEPADEDV